MLYPGATSYAVKFPTFGEIIGMCTPSVQWMRLALGKPPCDQVYTTLSIHLSMNTWVTAMSGLL